MNHRYVVTVPYSIVMNWYPYRVKAFVQQLEDEVKNKIGEECFIVQVPYKSKDMRIRIVSTCSEEDVFVCCYRAMRDSRLCLWFKVETDD